jgi:hypothetical protein
MQRSKKVRYSITASARESSVGGTVRQKSNLWHRRLLRMHTERPRSCRTTEKRYASPHAGPKVQETASYRLNRELS